MAYGHRRPDAATPPAITPADIEGCFDEVGFGIVEDGLVTGVAEINASEASEISERRKSYGSTVKAGKDAVGLALSGGGIRSATFCIVCVDGEADPDFTFHGQLTLVRHAQIRS